MKKVFFIIFAILIFLQTIHAMRGRVSDLYDGSDYQSDRDGGYDDDDNSGRNEDSNNQGYGSSGPSNLWG